jgi:hypothetical protein
MNDVLRRLHVARSRFAADEDTVLTESVLNAQTAVDPLSLDERVVYDADDPRIHRTSGLYTACAV